MFVPHFFSRSSDFPILKVKGFYINVPIAQNKPLQKSNKKDRFVLVLYLNIHPMSAFSVNATKRTYTHNYRIRESTQSVFFIE